MSRIINRLSLTGSIRQKNVVQGCISTGSGIHGNIANSKRLEANVASGCVLIGRVSTSHDIHGTVSNASGLVAHIVVSSTITHPPYDGDHIIVPSASEDQTLTTANKWLADDITVLKIPYAEVSNNSGGITATIGREVN